VATYLARQGKDLHGMPNRISRNKVSVFTFWNLQL
jgi:hypothetical protein